MSLTPEFQTRIKALLPAYQQFLAEHETDILASDVVVLYGRDSIEERNATHEVAEYLPGCVSIGNDSGDHEFLLKRDGSEAVLCADPGCFSAPSCLETIHASFSQWLAEGCPLPEEPENPIPLQGRIWLLAEPAGGMKDMIALKKFLALDWSIPEMKKCLEKQPALLVEDGRPFAVHRRLLEDSTFRPLLGFSAPASDVVHACADFDDIDGRPVRRS